MFICQLPHVFSTRSLSQVQKQNSRKYEISTDLDQNNEEGQINTPSALHVSKRVFPGSTRFVSHKRSQFGAPLTPKASAKPRCLLQIRSKAETFIKNSPVRPRIQIVNEKGQITTPKAFSKKNRRKSIPAHCFSSTSTSPCISHAKSNYNLEGNVNNSLLLCSYWECKKELEKKYKKLLDDLAVEEAMELNLRICKGVDVEGVIADVKNEYNMTRFLLLQQKLLEHEELVDRYKQEIQ